MNILTEISRGEPCSPAYIVDRPHLRKNLETLKSVMDSTGCKILLAQKAFSMYSLYPFIGKYLTGTCASGLHEARLGHEEMGGETHVYSPAYKESEFCGILKYADHIVFNSFPQWERFGKAALLAGKKCGLRINPECSTQQKEHAKYDPCAPFSRLGITQANFEPDKLDGITGLHFHTLCEQDADALETTLDAAEEKFGKYLKQMEWLNFGGGHHITRPGYDIGKLENCINRMRDKYGLEIYLEPGEAVVLNAGYLVSTVLEIIHNGMDIAVLDASAACHMPDVLEMPYHPEIIGEGSPGLVVATGNYSPVQPGEKPYTYRLGGPTCLAGDIIGDYSFDEPLKIGDKVIFTDMALYTIVKNNTFNGVNLPSIAVLHEDGTVETVREFGYADFKGRL